MAAKAVVGRWEYSILLGNAALALPLLDKSAERVLPLRRIRQPLLLRSRCVWNFALEVCAQAERRRMIEVFNLLLYLLARWRGRLQKLNIIAHLFCVSFDLLCLRKV